MKTLMMTAALLMASPALAGGLAPETSIRPMHRPEPCKIPILGKAGNVLYFNLSRSKDCRSTDKGDDDVLTRSAKTPSADAPERPDPGNPAQGGNDDGGGSTGEPDDGEGAGDGDAQSEGEPGDDGSPDSCGLARSRSGHRSWDAGADGRHDGDRAGRSVARDERDN